MTHRISHLCTVLLAGLLSLALLWTLAPAPTAHAQTFTVTKTDDTADGNCDEDCSLREAIIAANQDTGLDTIVLGPGIYRLTIAGNDEDNSATGDLDIRGDTILQGSGADQTIIDASGFPSNNLDRVLHIRHTYEGEFDPSNPGEFLSAFTPTVTIENVTITGGDARNYSNFASNCCGGGIRSEGTLTVRDSQIISNYANYAGGIYQAELVIDQFAATAPLLIENSLIADNVALRYGGGIATGNTAQVTIVDSVIEDNVVLGEVASQGGGLSGMGYITLTNTIVRNNRLDRDESDSCGLSGAGIYVDYGRLVLQDSQVISNSTGLKSSSKYCPSAPSGGGIYHAGGGGVEYSGLYLTNTQVMSNVASYTGGIHSGAGGRIENSIIAYNRADSFNPDTNGNGMTGGIEALDLVIINSEISHNRAATWGGGIRADGNTRIENSLVAHNQAGFAGGGIRGGFALISSTVRDNTAAYGGGIVAWGKAIEISQSLIANNTATVRGGGLMPEHIGPGIPIVEITNSTFSGNQAPEGGAIDTALVTDFDAAGRSVQWSGEINLHNTTVAFNRSTQGSAGILDSGSGIELTIENSLIANNDGDNCTNVSSDVSKGHNLSDDGFCSFTKAGDQVKVDAKLGPLQDNGGPTFTHALLEGSPAINAGDAAACLATDQRGVPRPQGPRCDIGAFEAEVTTPYLFVTPALLEFYAVAGATPPSAKTFAVENSGVGVLTWSASESTPWLSLDKSSGTAPMTVSVAISTTGLNPGSYNADVTVSADGAGGSPQTVAVSLTVIHAGSLLLNGDFELGRKSWSEVSLNSRALIRQGNDVPHTSPRSGVWAAVLGQMDGEISQLGQTITLPDGDDLSLIYYTFGHSSESQCDVEVALVRIDGQQVATHPLCQANNSSEWAMHEIDLNAYRGKQVTLHFYLATDPTSDPSTLLIDDVRLQLGNQPPPQTKWDIFLPTVNRAVASVPTDCTPSPAGDANSPGDALTICHDQTVNGQVDQNDYWDVYKIAIDANRAIAVNLTGGPGDANMRLYPPGTTSIDDGALADWSTAGSTSNESIQGTTLLAGEWFVVVYAWDGASDYQLKVTIGESVTATPCQPSPPGDSNNVGDALTVCPGQPVTGQVNKDSDKWDVYKVAYADNTATIIELSGQSGNAQMGLYGPSATDVTTDNPVRTSVNPGSDERITGVIRDPGDWYIAVVNVQDSTDYRLLVTTTFVGDGTVQQNRDRGHEGLDSGSPSSVEQPDGNLWFR